MKMSIEEKTEIINLELEEENKFYYQKWKNYKKNMKSWEKITYI